MNKKVETMWKKTRILPDLSSMQTQHLVQLEQCSHCRFMLFPGEQICSSCGAPVPKAAQHPGVTAQNPEKKGHKARRMVGLIVRIVVPIVVVLMLRAFYLEFGRVNTGLFLTKWLLVGIVLVVAVVICNDRDNAAANKGTGN